MILGMYGELGSTPPCFLPFQTVKTANKIYCNNNSNYIKATGELNFNLDFFYFVIIYPYPSWCSFPRPYLMIIQENEIFS